MISDSDTFTLSDGCYPADSNFLFGFKVLMLVFVPVAIGYMLWRIFVTNRAGSVGTNILGLNEKSATYSELSNHTIAWRTLFLYALTGVTFAFEVYWYVMDLLSA
jgi:hypothetical protein